MSTVELITTNTEQKGNALLLLILIAEGGDTRLTTLARLIGVCTRQVSRLIKQCEADGDLIVRRGQGRGHGSEYVIPYLSSDKKVTSVSPITTQEKVTSSPAETPRTSGAVTPVAVVEAEKATSPPPLSDGKVTPESPFAGNGDTGDAFQPPRKGDICPPPHTPHLDKNTSINKNLNNSNRAREAPVFTHEVPPAVGVYRDVFGTDPPPYGQDQIERDATDLPRWRETCEQWKGNNNDRTKVWNMLDAYKKKVSGDDNGSRREKQTGRPDGERRQLPRTPEPVNREWAVKNRV